MPLEHTCKSVIATNAAPAAIGPYSQAIRIGDTLFTSGQVALDPATGDLVPGGIASRPPASSKTSKPSSPPPASTMAHVVKTTVFLKTWPTSPP